MTRTLFLAVLLSAVVGCGADPTAAPDAPADEATTEKSADAAVFACPMHPDITADSAIECSKCGMTLVKQEAHDHGSHDHGDAKKDAPEHKEAPAPSHGHDDHEH